MLDQDKLLKIIETSREAINITAPDGKMVYTNDAMNKLFGYKKGALIGKHASILNAGLNPENVAKQIIDTIEKQDFWEGEVRNKRKDGTEFISYARASAVKDGDGKILNLVSTQHDITGEKKAKERLKHAIDEWQVTFNSSKELVMMLDNECRIVRANLAVAEFIGKPVADIGGKTCYELIHGKDKPPDMCPLETARRTKKRGETEVYLPEIGKWVLVIIDPILDDKGNIGGFIHVIRDVTERKRAEEALRENEEYARVFAAYQHAVSELREFYATKAGFKKMLQKTVNLFVKDFGYYMAWYGELKENEKVIIPKVWAGKYEKYLSGLRLELDDSKDAKCALSLAITRKGPFGYADLEHDKDFEKWRPLALKYGYRSNQAIPFILEDNCIGAFLIYSTRPRAFSENLVRYFMGIVTELATILEKITERKKAEEALQQSHNDLEIRVKERTAELARANEELRRQRLALEQKNIALREIVEQIEVEKHKIREDIATNVNELLFPALAKLRIKNASRKYIDLLHHHLNALTSSFGRKITEKSSELTPREIEICSMVKGGLTSKEISGLLNISPQTIEKHRKNIRHKLKISNKNINLSSYLHKL